MKVSSAKTALSTAAAVTQTFADVAAVGSGLVAARSDHVHGMPADPLPTIARRYIPRSGNQPATTATMPIATNTSMRVAQFVCEVEITVDTLDIEVTAVTVAGTYQIALYDATGTRLAQATTASITGAAMIRTAFGPVTLQPGTHYLGVTPIGTVNVTMVTSYAAGLIGAEASAGAEEVSGVVAVTAGECPATFNPDTSVTFNANALIICGFNG